MKFDREISVLGHRSPRICSPLRDSPVFSSWSTSRYCGIDLMAEILPQHWSTGELFHALGQLTVNHKVPTIQRIHF
jgi:hypothetical protein